MTLHEAMVTVLAERGGWMDRDELADEIATRDLYRQRDGGPAPSDQLRLRARKYEHLFEGSDTAYTRVRLRSADAAASRSARRSSGASGPGTTPVATAPPQGARSARRRRDEAARRYQPSSVKLLIVAEAPPAALDRYFYFEDLGEQDSLFRYVARGVLDVTPSRQNKRELLNRLCDEGVFLIDLSPEPLSTVPLSQFVSDLVARAAALRPEKVILIKATVYDAAFEALHAAGLPVVNERIPFPGSGQQKRFEAGFARALVA